jgi:teichoic acid transport system permease protein
MLSSRADENAAQDWEHTMMSAEQRAHNSGLVRIGDRQSLINYLKALWQRREFIRAYARAKTQAGYRTRRLGPLWEILDPLTTMATYWVLFGLLLGARTSVPNYLGYLAVGVFTFAVIRRSAQSGARSVSANRGLLTSLPIPAVILPTAAVVQQVRAFIVSLPILVIVLVSTGEPVTWSWLLAPLAVILIIPFGWGTALLLARWMSHTPDIGGVLPLVLRLWGLASGVMFPITERISQLDLPAWVEYVLVYNPGAVYLAVMRDALLAGYTPPGGIANWVAAAVWSLIATIAGVVVFWRGEGTYGRD